MVRGKQHNAKPITTMGLDLSLRGCGLMVARVSSTSLIEKVRRAKLLRTEPYNDNKPLRRGKQSNGVFVGNEDERIEWIVGRTIKAFDKFHPLFVGIEDHAFGIRNSRSLSGLHELQGVIKYELRKHNAGYASLVPSSLKKFATGDGRAEKQKMIDVVRTLGYPECPDFKHGGDNLADAAHLSRWSQQYYANEIIG